MRPHRVFAALVFAAALSGLAPTAMAAVLITIDKAAQRMTVMVDGELRASWPVSTGREGYDTPNGRYTPFRMVKDHYSREWDDAPMPHSIFFTRIGHAIHGTDHAKRLGQPASHGCVRLTRENAAELFALVKEHGVFNTSVVIEGAAPPPPAPPASLPVARRKPPVPEPDRAATTRFDRMPQDVRGGRMTREPPHRTIRVPSQRALREPSLRERPPPHTAAERLPPANKPRRTSPAPGVFYDPRVEIVEESYVNGTWVRRRYYRQARPQDYQRWR